MAKYQVNLGVTANVSQAQQSIQNLQSSLNNIANTKITVDGGSIDTAAQSARLLSEHLAKATNATTGKIDFTALSNSLKAANTDLATLSNNLLAMGPKGQQAFSQIANAVAHAELSTRKANSALQSFGVTLMNTIKWQAASSMIHGVMGAFNSAVSHIEKLDKSLNSIQIVTGKTAAQMASFAKQAQEASRALSSTTQEYSDAALIYFQQGLGEKEIAERTEATIKMAKVTGDAVATVSDQLTAIWNNFDDGTQSLEHYVDVITALGAATASSSDEISDGLQKFAAIAETVGLSYEYAATALATVTAETRQSADVVGTAFKTLFARIQGLKLGETLDDGTTLNQYSKALAKVGIDIKMSSGELKSMNDILDEMGEKWERLNKDQQVALAQTVGGIRQYNQLIALMDNWDTFKINLEIAEDSKGELDKQFEIYQSSVEASAATLKQAKEALFENMLSPDMISGFNEALADTIDLFNTLIENAGGIGKLLEFGGLLLLQTVLPKLQMFLMNAATHLKDFIGYTKAAKMYELDTMSKTSHSIAGTSQRTNTRLSSPYEEGSRKANRFERREDHRMASYDKWDAKASAAQETLEQGPQKGLQHGINVVRASVADAKAQAYSSTGATFMSNTQGVSGVDMDASAMTMRNQMIQEEAGYTATILDTKKQILALENGLTDKQREGYKAYSDQVAKEQEALRLAREKQAVTKDTAEQSSRSGTMKVGSSKAGRDAKAAMKQGEIDQLEEERKKKISSLTGDKESISRQTSEIDKEYNKKKEEVQNRHISNKQVDLKGEETQSMVEGFKDSDMSNTGQAITQSMTESLAQSADGSGPAASVENLEKLGQLQAQYNADAAKASGIYTELSGNIGEAGKRTEQQQKTLKKTGDTMKSLGKDAKSGLVDSLKESAKQMEKTGDSAEGLKKVIKSLEDGSDIDLGELNPKEIDAVKKSVGNLDEGLTEASTSAGELANAMSQDMASATGQDAKIFTGIAEDAQAAKASALEADGAAKQLQNTLNTQPPIMPDPFGTVLQGAQKATAAFTSFAMGAQMLSTGITTAFDENATAVEKLMGVMMILQGVMSTINAVQSVANIVDTIAVAVKAAKAAAIKKESDAEVKDTVTTGTNTVATSANAVAKLFAAMASKGLAGIIAGALGAALIIGTILTVKNTIATQNEAKAQQKAAEEANAAAESHQKNAKAIAEETKEINKNAEAYKKLYEAYLETGEAKTDFIEASVDLASSLQIEGAELLALTGQYEKLNREIREKLRLQNQDNKKAARDSVTATGSAIVTAVGGTVADNPTRIIGATASSKGQLVLHAGSDGAFISEFLDSQEGNKYKEKGFYYDSGAQALVVKFSDDSEVPELTAMVDEMMSDPAFLKASKSNGGKGSSSTVFSSYTDMKERGGEAWTKASEVVDAERNAIVDASFANVDFQNADSATEFKKEYDKYIQMILNDAGVSADSELGQELIRMAEEKIRADGELTDQFNLYKASESLPQVVKDYLAKQHGGNENEITDDEYTLATKIWIDPLATETEVQNALAYAQDIADKEEIDAKINLIPEAAKGLKPGMSVQEWENWFDEYAGEGDPLQTYFDTDEEKTAFIKKSPEEQQAYLESLTPSREDKIEANNTVIAGARTQQQTDLDTADEYKAKAERQQALIDFAMGFNESMDTAKILSNHEATQDEKMQAVLAHYRKVITNIQGAMNYGFLEYNDLFFGEDIWNNPGLYKDEIEAQHQKMVELLNEEFGTNFVAYAMTKDIPGGAYGFEGQSGIMGTSYGIPLDGTPSDMDTAKRIQAESYDGYLNNKEAAETQQGIIDNAIQENKMLKASEFNEILTKEDLPVEEAHDYAEALLNAKDAEVETIEEAEALAVANLKLSKGLSNIADGYDEIAFGLKNKDKDLYAYSKALRQIKDGIEDIFNIDNADVFSEAFLASEENLRLMKEAAEGSESALKQLRLAAAEDIIINAKLDPDVTSTLTTSLNNFINSAEFANLEIGADLNTTSFGMALQKMLDDGKITADQMSAILTSIGGTPPVSYIEVPANQASQFMSNTNQEVLVPDPANPGNYIKQTIQNKNLSGVDGATMIRIPVIGEVDWSAIKAAGGKQVLSSSFQGHSAPQLNPSKGGGGGNAKKTEKTKKSDVVERYKEVNDQIDDMEDKLRKANREAEGLWGAARLKKMRQIQSEMKKELKLMRQRRDEAKVYLEEDRQALQEAAKENGVAAFTFDANNNITNYDEIMNGLYAELKAAQDAAGPTTDDNEQKKIDAIQERIDAIKDAISDFDNTREELEDFEDEIDEWIRGIQEAYLEELNLELEMKVMIDDSQLAKIEYYLGKVSEDIWSMAESAALMTGQGKDLFNFDLGQAEVWIGKFDDFKKRYDDLLYAYTHIDPETGETFINQEQFVQSLAELQTEIYDNLNNINELDKTMIDYYGETLAAAGEELSKFTDLMDHHVSVLDHYSSLLEIMGKSKDWERMKTVLSAQVEVAKNSADVSKANYEMLQRQAEDKKAAWEAAKNNDTLSDYEKSVIEKQWLDAQNAANEAQSKMLEDAQAWAEALKSLLETELEELGENLEKALAGDFGSLDYMMTSMERANSLQEEYLTTTNKIYETNKLMRSAQQEIDKTSNTVAKRRMAQFIEETQQMQNQNKLSQYELEIQQAKYDLLLAEIALEEAQAAKSTVRLQRDSEGNFGYVYTADQNEVDKAQQELEDAQNALYNIGLEGANKYAEQYAQTIQEMNDEIRNLTEQWQNGEIASKEEYQAKMLDLEAYYGEKLMQFSDLHSKAIMTDSRVASEAWTKDFATMTSKTQLWMQQVNVYVQGVEASFTRYQQGIDEVEQYAGMDLDSLAQKTEQIKNDNDALRDSITDPDNGLIKAMEDEINKVGELALAYAEWRKEIQGAIADQEDLARLIGRDVEKESDDDESNDYKPEEETPSPEEETPPEETPPEDTTPSYKKGTLTWTGSGGSRVWTDSTGKTYSASSAEGKAIQNAFDRAYSKNGGYKGDYWLGWNKLNADVLHEKYGLSTGGYTGDWAGSFGKLAFLHQKELVLNKQDTENLLTAMEFLNRIISAIDLQSMNNSLGGLLSSPSLGRVGDEGGILEQQVHIEASFPGITEHSELEQAFNNLINEAAQYANRK